MFVTSLRSRLVIAQTDRTHSVRVQAVISLVPKTSEIHSTSVRCRKWWLIAKGGTRCGENRPERARRLLWECDRGLYCEIMKVSPESSEFLDFICSLLVAVTHTRLGWSIDSVATSRRIAGCLGPARFFHGAGIKAHSNWGDFFPVTIRE